MMDRRNLKAQRRKVARLALAAGLADAQVERTKSRLSAWIQQLGTPEGLAGAFLVGGLVGLKTAPESEARRDDADCENRDDSGGDGALLRWLNTGLLLWRLQATATAAGASSYHDFSEG